LEIIGFWIKNDRLIDLEDYLNKRDWNLLVVDSAGGDFISPLQLQKALFLIGKNISPRIGSDFYDFKPYNYGPFSLDIYKDIESLISDGDCKAHSKTGQSWTEFHITEQGRKKAEALYAQLPQRDLEYVRELVSWINKLTFKQLLGYIYKNYPEFATKSIFKFNQ
jgi:uncharacterized protein